MNKPLSLLSSPESVLTFLNHCSKTSVSITSLIPYGCFEIVLENMYSELCDFDVSSSLRDLPDDSLTCFHGAEFFNCQMNCIYENNLNYSFVKYV